MVVEIGLIGEGEGEVIVIIVSRQIGNPRELTGTRVVGRTFVLGLNGGDGV